MIKCETVGNRRTEKVGKGKEQTRGRQEIKTVCNKSWNRESKGFEKVWVCALWDIKSVRSGLYGEDRDENYFIIICI